MKLIPLPLSLVIAVLMAGCDPAIPVAKARESLRIKCDVTNIYTVPSDTTESLKIKVSILNEKVNCLVDLIKLSDIDLNSL